MRYRKAVIAGVGMAMCLGIAAQVEVAESAIIDFNIASPTTGTISYAGGNAALVGANISVDTLMGLTGIPVNANTVLNCVGCQLNFSTGDYFGSQTNNLTGTTEWLFNGGGTISLTGAVTDTGNNTVVSNATLFSGAFTGAATLQVSTTLFTFSVAQGAFAGQDNAALLSYFGLAAASPMNGGMSISFMPVGTPAVAAPFTSNFITSGTVINDVVPIPAAGLLFLSGLAGLGWLRRRNATV